MPPRMQLAAQVVHPSTSDLCINIHVYQDLDILHAAVQGEPIVPHLACKE